jgi:hypothetical protein
LGDIFLGVEYIFQQCKEDEDYYDMLTVSGAAEVTCPAITVGLRRPCGHTNVHGYHCIAVGQLIKSIAQPSRNRNSHEPSQLLSLDISRGLPDEILTKLTKWRGGYKPPEPFRFVSSA